MRSRLAATVWLLTGVVLCGCGSSADVQIGSKKFTESVVLGDLAELLGRDVGVRAEHDAYREVGGTRVLWEGLLMGTIDVYPEYTGTMIEELLLDEAIETDEQLHRALNERGLVMTPPLGFNNTYAIGMTRRRAAELGIRTISDLREHPGLRFGFNNEFMDRGDGWRSLQQRYALPQQDVRGMDHDLAYRALDSGSIDVMDLYSTDAEIEFYDLVVLEDDQRHFPRYDAVFLYRRELQSEAPAFVAALERLAGRISEADMAAMNAKAKIERIAARRVAADFLAAELGVDVEVVGESVIAQIGQRTKEHLFLVVVSLSAAVLVAVPLGVVAAKRPRAGTLILSVVGIIQTIPALALLVLLMRPLDMLGIAGIGQPPAIVALFLYSLLPIVRNTHAGLTSIDPPIRESAIALGLPAGARLWFVEVPLASRTILAGIKTAAVINVGFATLGALIGAKGYGQPIITGIRLADNSLILQGAIPAALLALAVQGLFELAERAVVPKGLRLRPAE